MLEDMTMRAAMESGPDVMVKRKGETLVLFTSVGFVTMNGHTMFSSPTEF
jgi:hypothetical protein